MGKQVELYADCPPDTLRERLTQGVARVNAILNQWHPVDGGSAAWKIRFKLTWRGNHFTLSRWESAKGEGAYVGMGYDILCNRGRPSVWSGIHHGYEQGLRSTLCSPFRGRISVGGNGSVMRGGFTMSWPARGMIWGMALFLLCLAPCFDSIIVVLGILLCVFHGIRGELRAKQTKGCDHILKVLERSINNFEEADL